MTKEVLAMLITAKVKEQLSKRGVSTLWGHEFNVPDTCVFEPPCSLKWMSVEWHLKLGAFSYAVSGYYFGAEIGRYTSIGESVQVGRGSHPVTFASTSPAFYEKAASVFHVNLPQANDYQINAVHIPSKPTIIGNDVYIGHGAFLMQGIKVGDGAVIGAMSVVTKDVPPYSVVAGSPAVVRKMRFPPEIVARMEAVKWWQYAFWDLSCAPVSDPSKFLDFVESARDRGIEMYKPDVILLRDLCLLL